MYYVIQSYRDDPLKHFITYSVPKYIVAPNNKNIIFEFVIEGKVKRKWAPKEDIILLTDNEEFYRKILASLKSIKEQHLKKIEKAEVHLTQEVDALSEAMNKQFRLIESQQNGSKTLS
ncbi:MAG: hypothetical protein U9N52_11480 [Campylobacterota bacterium]|nr:hypothetical protein [Campylobacterota bacterium]